MVTATGSDEKLVSGPMTIEKKKYFYDEIKTTDKYVFYYGWLRSNNKLSVKNSVSILLFYYPKYLIIRRLSCPIGAGLKELYCN